MSGGLIFNRVVKYTEVKFEGYWEVTGAQALLLTPPGFVTYTFLSGQVEPTPNPPSSPPVGSITITRTDGKVLAIPLDSSSYFACAVGENAILFISEPDQPSGAPFK